MKKTWSHPEITFRYYIQRLHSGITSRDYIQVLHPEIIQVLSTYHNIKERRKTPSK
jgi:hypothetical protein